MILASLCHPESFGLLLKTEDTINPFRLLLNNVWYTRSLWPTQDIFYSMTNRVFPTVLVVLSLSFIYRDLELFY